MKQVKVSLSGLKKEALQESYQINPKLSGHIFRQLVSLYIKKKMMIRMDRPAM